MNRGSVGCSAESACGVGLANCQDARNICECGKDVNYICEKGMVPGANNRDINNSRREVKGGKMEDASNYCFLIQQ